MKNSSLASVQHKLLDPSIILKNMRILKKTALLALALTTFTQAEPLKLVSWNIEWFPGVHPNASRADAFRHLKATKVELERLAPQIFLGQEITDARSFEKLAEVVPGMKVHVISKFIGRDGRKPSPQQCAIASTLSAHSAWFEEFERHENLPSLSRGFSFAALNHPEGGLLMLYCVHLKSNRGSDTPEGERNVAATRAESVKQLVAHKKKMEEQFAKEKIVGWVIAGDFNTNHDGQFPLCTVVKDLESAGFYNTWAQTPKEERLTWRSDPNPEERRFQPTTFDYIMTSSLKKTQAVIPPDVPREISDHHPVMLMLSTK